MNCWKNTIMFGIKLVIAFKKKLDWEPAYRASLFFKPECM